LGKESEERDLSFFGFLCDPVGAARNRPPKTTKKGPEGIQKKIAGEADPFWNGATAPENDNPSRHQKSPKSTPQKMAKKGPRQRTRKFKKNRRRSKSPLERTGNPKKRQPLPTPMGPENFTPKWARKFLKYPAARLPPCLRQLLALRARSPCPPRTRAMTPAGSHARRRHRVCLASSAECHGCPVSARARGRPQTPSVASKSNCCSRESILLPSSAACPAVQ